MRVVETKQTGEDGESLWINTLVHFFYSLAEVLGDFPLDYLIWEGNMFLLTADFTLVVIWKGLGPKSMSPVQLRNFLPYTHTLRWNIAMETGWNWILWRCISYWKWGYSIAMLVYQRVIIIWVEKWLFGEGSILLEFKDLYIFYLAMIVGGRSSVKCCFHKPKSCSMYGICVYKFGMNW